MTGMCFLKWYFEFFFWARLQFNQQHIEQDETILCVAEPATAKTAPPCGVSSAFWIVPPS